MPQNITFYLILFYLNGSSCFFFSFEEIMLYADLKMYKNYLFSYFFVFYVSCLVRHTYADGILFLYKS